jgi:hypothetical protein
MSDQKEKTSLFKKIDTAIFRQIDTLINHPNYREVMSNLDSLTDEQVKVFNHAFSYFLISFPLIIFFVVLVYFFNVTGTLSTHKEILDTIDEITANKSSVGQLERNLISPGEVKNINEFQTKIAGILSRYAIASDKVTVKTFASETSSGNIHKNRSQVVFSRFSSKNLADFLGGLTLVEKLKVIDIEIKKTEDKTQLFGQMTLIHYGRN